jgi:hypothetical protein
VELYDLHDPEGVRHHVSGDDPEKLESILLM